MILEIKGNLNQLSGNVLLQGDKIATTHLFYAALISNQEIKLINFSFTSELKNIIEICKRKGFAKFKYLKNKSLLVYAQSKSFNDITSLCFNRSSICLVSSIGQREGKVVFSNVGGCNFTSRPIDGHLMLLETLGFKINLSNKNYTAIKIGCRNNFFIYDCSINGIPSVGITCHALLTSINGHYNYISLSNIAIEPTIITLVNLLIAINRFTILLNKEQRNIILVKNECKNMLNRIEITIPIDYLYLVTFLGMGIISKNFKIKFYQVYEDIPNWLVLFLKKTNINWKKKKNYILVKGTQIKQISKLTCEHWPGIPSDIGPILFASFLSYKNEYQITDNVYDKRSSHIQELAKLGYSVYTRGNTVFKNSNDKENNHLLDVYAKDIRCGAALIIAGLSRERILIHNFEQILRGYTLLAYNFKNLNINHKIYE